MFSGPWVWRDVTKEKNVQKFEKNCTFCQKNVETTTLPLETTQLSIFKT